MGGKGSGRPRSGAGDVRRAEDIIKRYLPEYMQIYSDLALGRPLKCPHCGQMIERGDPDTKALAILIERGLGKVAPMTDHRRREHQAISADDYEEAARSAQYEEQALLDS